MFVLFKGDKEKYYPNAIYDTKTTNKSFLQYVKLLETMGIENRYWCLTLINPLLQGVDPFSDQLTIEQQVMIRVECEMNPWYFVREILRFPPSAGDQPIRLIANRANMSLWWCFLNHIDYFLIQPRQTGKSVNSDGITSWYMMFGTKNSRCNLFTKDGDLIANNIKRLKRIRNIMPKYLVTILKGDTDNQKDLTYVARGNYLNAIQAQANPDAAANVGRGITTPYNHVDEICYLKYNRISVGIMLAGGGAVRDQARAQGIPYGNIFTSTAGKLDTDMGKYAYTMLRGGTIWSENYYDSKNEAELRIRLQANSGNVNSKAVLINGTFSHRQLGFTDDWLREKIADARQDPDDSRRDFLNEWTVGDTTNHPLSKKVMRAIDRGRMSPTYEEFDSVTNYMIRWYIPKDEIMSGIRTRTLVMGMDMSEGVGRDRCTGVIVDAATLEVVGVYGIAEGNLAVMAGWFVRLLERFPTLTLVPEAKSTWRAVQDRMVIVAADKDIDFGRRVYSTIVDDKADSYSAGELYNDFKNWRGGFNHYTEYKRYFGFGTNADKRRLIYDVVFKEYTRVAGWLMRDDQLIGEIKGIQIKNGRVDHAAGAHDDHLVSWLLAMWFISFGKNVSHYGIDPIVLRSKVYSESRNMTHEEKADEVLRRMRNLELRELTQRYEEIKGDSSADLLLRRIQILQSQLGDHVESDLALNIDGLKNQVDTNRKMESRGRRREGDFIRYSRQRNERWHVNQHNGYGLVG